MQSGFPTANLPRSADTAAAVDRHSATGRPSGDTDSARESAFSDMVETARSTEETPVRKPAGQAKAGERAVPSDTLNTGNTDNTGNAPAAGHSGNTPASGQPAPAPATEAPADVQDVTATSQKPARGKSAETGRPAAAQPAVQQTAAQPTAQPAQAASAVPPGTAPATAAPGNTAVPAAAADGAAQAPDSTTAEATRAAPASVNTQSGTSAKSATAAQVQNTGPATAPTVTNPASNSTPGSQPGADAPDLATEPAKQASTAKTADTDTASKTANTAPSASPTPDASGTRPDKPVQTANAGTQTAKLAQPDATSPAASESAAASSGSAMTSAMPTGAQTQAATAGATTAAATTATANAMPQQQTGQAPAPLRETPRGPAILETGGNSASAKSSSGKSAAPSGQRVSTPPTGQGSVQSNATVDGSNVTPVSPQRDPNAPTMSPLMQALAQPAGSAEQAPVQPLEISADAAQSDAEIQLNRTGDVRAPVDRAGANLPRFAPHTAQHLAGQITRQFNNGQRVFDIRLDPAELGKVDVRLELRADNRVHAVLSAERPETLAELQRAARDLERSLNEAGLELAEEGLTFQLSDEGGDTPGSQRDPSATTMPIFAEGGEIGLTDEATAPIVQQSKYGFLLSRRSGVDMRV